MKLTERIREAIADHFFEEELDYSFNLGVREGYRNGVGAARSHYFNLIQTHLKSLHDSVDAKHKHGLGLALAYLDSLEKEGNREV